MAPDSYRYLSAAQRINLDLPLVGQQRLAPGYAHSLAWLQRRGLELMAGIQVTVLAQCLLSLAAWGTWRGKRPRGEACLVWGFLGGGGGGGDTHLGGLGRPLPHQDLVLPGVFGGPGA